MVIFKHVAKDRQGFPRSKGDPRDGWDELEPNRSYLSHFTTWYSKSGHFPIENPIKNENWPLTPSYGSIILKIVLWAHFTNSHVVLSQSSDILKNPYFGTGYYEWPAYYTGTWGRLFTGTESDPLDENLNFNSAIQLLAGLKVQILTWNFAPIYLLEIVIAPPSESNKRVTYIGYQRKNSLKSLFTAKGDFFLLKNHL